MMAIAENHNDPESEPDSDQDLATAELIPVEREDDEEDDDLPIAQYPAAISKRLQLTARCNVTDNSTTRKRKRKDRPTEPFPSSIPTFCPLTIEPTRSKEKGQFNPWAFRNASSRTPLGIFSKFFTADILQTIVSNTNEYARRKIGDGGGRKWIELEVNELKCFLGICIYMGVYKSPSLEEYWNRNKRFPLSLIHI